MQKIYKLLNVYFPLRDFLYILQLEEYDVSRYLQQVQLRIFSRNFEKLQSLELTWRAKVLSFLTMGAILFLLAIFVFFHITLALALLILLIPVVTPFLLAVVSLSMQPLIYLGTKLLIAKAHSYFKKNNPNTQVIAITGSFGKTTTKYLLFELLQHTYRTAMIPKNINTTLGIANYIRHGNIPTSTEYLIVEMGAYTQGDIKKTCQVVSPDIAIITALADQHMERFGSFKKLVLAKNEIFEATLNKHNTFAPEAVCTTLQKYNKLKPDTNCVDINIPYNVPLLRHARELTGNVALACAVAQSLKVTDSFIVDTLEKFTLPDRRKDYKYINGIEVIDNSYNISPTTARSAIENAAAYAKEKHKELVVITGGISEQGKDTQQANEILADLLNKHAVGVILLNTIYAPSIESRLTDVTCIRESNAISVLNTLSNYADVQKNIVLQLPTHNDLYYL